MRTNRRGKGKIKFLLLLVAIFLAAFSGVYYFKIKSENGTNTTNTVKSEKGTNKLSRAEKILQDMTLEEKVYQMFIAIPEQIDDPNLGHEPDKFITEYNKNMEDNIKSHPVGGIILFAKNILSPSQCEEFINSFNKNSKLPLFISVDEEGGMVARVAKNPEMGTTKFPNMIECKSKEEAYNIGYTIGSEIKKFGFNLDFAPVSDVNSNPNNPVIGKRAFGSDPNKVAEFVSYSVKGFRDSKMLCTLKHFPGHGDTLTDTHKEYASINKTMEELEKIEFVPFKSGIEAGADFVMIGHLSVPKVTQNDLPATLTDTFISYLKNNLGFNGIIITDAMRMKAIADSYEADEAAVLAIKAGIDVILIPENLSVAANGILDAVEKGIVSEQRINESVKKIIEKKIESGIIE